MASFISTSRSSKLRLCRCQIWSPQPDVKRRRFSDQVGLDRGNEAALRPASDLGQASGSIAARNAGARRTVCASWRCKEEEDMRKLLIAVLGASMAALPACATRQVAATPPTVTYSYNSDSDYDEIVNRAAQYCRDKYGQNAVLVDRAADNGGHKARFACK
jgi:hypothetical protein